MKCISIETTRLGHLRNNTVQRWTKPSSLPFLLLIKQYSIYPLPWCSTIKGYSAPSTERTSERSIRVSKTPMENSLPCIVEIVASLPETDVGIYFRMLLGEFVLEKSKSPSISGSLFDNLFHVCRAWHRAGRAVKITGEFREPGTETRSSSVAG